MFKSGAPPVLALQALIKRYIWCDAAAAIKVGASRGQKAAAWQVWERGIVQGNVRKCRGAVQGSSLEQSRGVVE